MCLRTDWTAFQHAALDRMRQQFPATMGGKIALVEAMLSLVDEDGRPCPLITPEEARKMLNAP